MNKLNNYKVTWTINMEGFSPLSVAKKAQAWLRKDDWQFYVMDEDSKECFSVDLQEEDEEAVISVNLSDIIGDVK